MSKTIRDRISQIEAAVTASIAVPQCNTTYAALFNFLGVILSAFTSIG